MKTRVVHSSWFEKEGRRLDCGPYLSGAIEAKLLLEKICVPKEPLYTLTAGHDGGIYNGPHFARNYVTDPAFGVPFLTSSSMLHADLSRIVLLRKRDALSTALSFLNIQPGTTLISCSGTIGRMVFARSDFEGIWSSQHILKVVPNESKILPGYLYGFLASQYGIPLIVGGTYGSVIQHIEPSHIANLPVPRLNDQIERDVHELIESAGHLLCKYQAQIRQATNEVFAAVGLRDISPAEWHSENTDLGFARKVSTSASLRALNFNPRFQELSASLHSKSWRPLSEICKPGTLRRAGRYKRIDAEPEYAYQLIGQKEIFWLRPEGRWIAKRSVGDDMLVEQGTILVAAQGTLGESELYCRPEFIWGSAVDRAYSEHLLRVIADDDVMPPGCLFAFMRSETAFRLLRSTSMGTKLQDHHPVLLRELPVPYPEREIRHRIHDLVIDAYEKRQRSVNLEDEAIRLVERAVREAV